MRRRTRALLLAGVPFACGCSLVESFAGYDDGTRPVDASIEAQPTVDAQADSTLLMQDGSVGANLDGGPDALPSPLVCDDGGVACDAGCAALDSDPLNCGACGHSCGAAVCTSGVCGAVTLASGPLHPQGIVLDAEYVYFTATGDGTILRVPQAGGKATVLASGQDQPSMIALVGSTLYWTNNGPSGPNLLSLPTDGGSPATVFPGQNSAFGVTASQSTVYVTLLSADDGGLGAIEAMQLDGGAATPVAEGLETPAMLALGSTSLFWTEEGGMVKGIDLDGGGLRTLASSAGIVFGVATDGVSVYYTDWGGGVIGKVPVDGGPTVPLVVGEYNPRCILVDGSMLYWAAGSGDTGTEGFVRKMPVTGGIATTLWHGEGSPLCLAVNATDVFWTDYVDNTVMKVAK